jgi:hypothetical protein
MKMVQNSAVMCDTRKFCQKMASQLELLIYCSLESQTNSKMCRNIALYSFTSELDTLLTHLMLKIQKDILKMSTNNVHQTINQSFVFLTSLEWDPHFNDVTEAKTAKVERTKQLSLFRRFSYLSWNWCITQRLLTGYYEMYVFDQWPETKQ